MISITLTGTLVSEVHLSVTANGIARATFVIESQETNSLPIRYNCACFGRHADEAASLPAGTSILLVGRCTAGERTKKVSLSVNHFEVLSQPQPQAESGEATA